MISRPLTEDDKKEICEWRYEGEYAIYNLPSFEELRETKRGFCSPDREMNYRAFISGGVLVGFTNIMEKGDEVFIGIGVRPDCCGKHFGREILGEACRAAKKRFPDKTLCLEVRIWNERAVRCYQNAGFVFDGEPYEKTTPAGKGVFVRMIRKEMPEYP